MDDVIVDAHAHVFPPDFIKRRTALTERDSTFAEIYGDPRARMATADEVLVSMETAGVDVTVIAGFSWLDPGLCREHNEYILDSAAGSSGRLLPFCTLPLSDLPAARLEVSLCASGGARGFGELRPESQGVSLDDAAVADLLTWAAEAYDAPLLFHASEPVGHSYAGKGGQSLGGLYGFIDEHPEVRIIAAHWGGGLPFYALMPEVKVALEHVWFDTAAGSLLYDREIYRVVAGLIGSGHLLFGSDYPLLSPGGQLELIASAGLSEVERARILGDNAAALFHLEGRVA
jgi:predicted TIM-barrel fold metal-dependent hydrolase